MGKSGDLGGKPTHFTNGFSLAQGHEETIGRLPFGAVTRGETGEEPRRENGERCYAAYRAVGGSAVAGDGVTVRAGDCPPMSMVPALAAVLIGSYQLLSSERDVDPGFCVTWWRVVAEFMVV